MEEGGKGGRKKDGGTVLAAPRPFFVILYSDI